MNRSYSTPLWVMVALILALSGCGEATESGDKPATTSAEVSPAASIAPTTTTSTSDEGGNVASTDEPREPVDLTEAPEAVTLAPPEGAGDPGEQNPGEQSPGEDEPGDPLVVLPDPKIPRGFESLVAPVVADLAATLGVDEAEIGVTVAEAVVWPDASLGCPQPGMAYAQVQVEGWRTVLTHGGVSYVYHGGESRPDPFLCSNPTFPIN